MERLPMAKKKSGPNKSDFIRSLPAPMPAADVVAKAKEAGITITAGLVYAVRAAQKKKSAKAGRGAKAAAAAPAKGSSGATHRAEFRRLLILIGLDQGEAFCAEM